jgi:hypothetical protein
VEYELETTFIKETCLAREEISIEELFGKQPTIEQPTWISCAERLPEEAREYIVMTNALGKSKGVMAMEYRFIQVRGKPVKRWEWNNRISPWIVTHWMSLPQPPKGDE